MTPKKHFLHVFATFAPAGYQVRAVGLMNALASTHRHTIISCSADLDAERLLDDAVERTILKVEPKAGPLGHARALRRVLRQQQPDLLLSYNWGSMDAAFAARMAGFKRHVHHEDGFNADEAEALKGRRNWARRLTLKHAEVVVPSRQLLGIVQDTWHLPKATLIPNGVHLGPFAANPERAAALRDQWGIPSNALVIGTVAHLRPVKRLDRLIRACALIDAQVLDGKPLYLLVVGDGEQRQALEELARQHAPVGGKVIFAGYMSDPAPAYGAMDMLALSSASEQQPISILEAMAASLPVFSTDVGDVRYTVPEESVSMLVDPTLPDDKVEQGLAASLSQALSDGELRTSLGKASFRHVEQKYSFQAMLSAYNTVFERAMG